MAAGLWMLTLIAAFSSWPRAQAACYYPSGRLAPNDTPCRDGTPHATCCGQSYACLSNGICQATGDELKKPGATEFVRGACTDKTWQSSSCPLFCIQEGVDFLDGGNGIFQCPNTDDDVYFCVNRRFGTGSSCAKRTNVLSFAGKPSAITIIGVAPRSTASSTNTTISSSATVSHLSSASEAASLLSSTSEAPSPLSSASKASSSTVKDQLTSASSSSSVNTAAPEAHVPVNDADTPPASTPNLGPIIGGAAGATVAIFLAGLGGWLLARKRSNGDGKAKGNKRGDPAHELPGDLKYAFNNAQYPPIYEAPGVLQPRAQQAPYELATTPMLAELPAGSP